MNPNSINITSTPAGLGLPSGISNNSTTTNQENTNTIYVPKRKAAIICENIETVTQDQCLRAVADVIGGRNIHYCSRLSGGRICMYLTNEDCVETICKGGGVLHGAYFIPCRRYVTDATKFIISNCPPELQDEDLKKLLAPYGKVVSAPTRLKVSTVHEDLKHIKTWRRSVYVMIPSDAAEMPKRLLITSSDGLKQTLYIERDEIVCTFCLVPGHSVDKCKKRLNHEQAFPAINTPVAQRLLVNRTSRPPSTPTINNFMPTFVGSTPKTTPEAQTETPVESSAVQMQVPLPNETIPVDQSTPITLTSENLRSFQELISQNLTQEAENVPSNQDEDSDSWLYQPSIKDLKRKNRSLDEDDQADIEMVTDSSLASSTTSAKTCALTNPASKKKQKIKNGKNKENTALTEVVNQMKFKPSFLNKDDFLGFMKDARGKANSRNIAARYTENFGALIIQLQEAELLCQDFNLRRRFQRAADALLPAQPEDEEEKTPE